MTKYKETFYGHHPDFHKLFNDLNLDGSFIVVDSNPQLSPFVSAMINTQWLELSKSRTNYPNDGRVTDILTVFVDVPT